jgi:hypothetical protein
MPSDTNLQAPDAVRHDYLFVASCILAYAAAVLIVPPYMPLIDPDSASYIQFLPWRTALYPTFLAALRALGLDLVEVTWVQLAIFCAALAYLLTVLLRAAFPRWMLAIFVALLAGNVLFSSLHRSIQTESIYFSLSAVAVGLWVDYLRRPRSHLLFALGLALGFMIGVRPAGFGILPMLLIAVWLKRPENLSKWMLLAVIVLPVCVGAVTERLIYRAVHGSVRDSTARNLAMGLSAMLIKPDMTFSGRHAAELKVLGAQLYKKYEPVHRYLDSAPSLPVRTQLSALYQGEAQFYAFGADINEVAQHAGISVADLEIELGKQVVFRNLRGYLELTLVNQLGQWSVAAQNFPPIARQLAAYANANPAISFGGRIPDMFLHPRPTTAGWLVYPAFLIAGAITLGLTVVFFLFLWRPRLMESPAGFYLGLAAFFSAMCQGYTFFISLINVWTPRFLMAVIPQLEIVAMCLLLILLHRSGATMLRVPTAVSDGGNIEPRIGR